MSAGAGRWKLQHELAFGICRRVYMHACTAPGCCAIPSGSSLAAHGSSAGQASLLLLWSWAALLPLLFGCIGQLFVCEFLLAARCSPAYVQGTVLGRSHGGVVVHTALLPRHGVNAGSHGSTDCEWAGCRRCVWVWFLGAGVIGGSSMQSW